MQKTHYQFGPGGAVYLLSTIMIVAGAIWTQANLLFLAFGLATGALVISLILSALMMRKLSVQRLTPTQGVTGQPMVLRYRIENRGWFPVFGLVVHESWTSPGWRGRWQRWFGRRRPFHDPTHEQPPRLMHEPMGWVLHVGPKQTAQAEAMCWPLRRGPIDFEQVVLTSSFPFGIIRKSLTVRQRDAVPVYPRLYRVSRLILHRATTRRPGGRTQLDRPGGCEEFFGLRRYRDGDNLKSIDWKHSAKTGQLIARELTQASPPRIMLAVDLRAATTPAGATPSAGTAPVQRPRKKPKLGAAPADDPVEQTISMAASLVCDCYLQGYQIGLSVWGVRAGGFAIHHSLPHRTKILEALAQLDAHTPCPPSEWSATVAAEPSIIVRPGASVGEGRMRNGRIVLGADDLAHYMTAVDEETPSLLAGRAPRSTGQQTRPQIARRT